MRYDAIVSRLAVITPEEARRLSNRFLASGKVDHKSVRAYADDMKRGRWLPNGATVVLSGDGDVLDGRARLLACILADTPFETLLVRGVDAGVFETIDAVRKRTLADVLTIRRYSHGRALGAALRIIWAYMAGAVMNGRSPSSIALLDLIEGRPEIRDSIRPSAVASPILPHGQGIALHYLFSLVDSKKADDFFYQLSLDGDSGVGCIAQLRKVLGELRQRGSRRRAYVLAVSIKTWNAFVAGKEVRALKFDPEREGFPVIAGLRLEEARVSGLSTRFKPDLFSVNVPESGLVAAVELIGPSEASAMLSFNNINRRISGVIVDKYARDMREGRWVLNGQTIKIGSDGRLLDGQHRLEAVKKAGRPFYAIVVRGVPPSTFVSLDMGRRRGLSEILKDRGQVNTATLASALRWLWMLKHEVFLSANVSPTNGELLDILSDNPKISHSIRFTSPMRDMMGSGVSAALHHEFSRFNSVKADEFFSRLIDGIGLSADNPVYHLREIDKKQKLVPCKIF